MQIKGGLSKEKAEEDLSEWFPDHKTWFTDFDLTLYNGLQKFVRIRR